MDDDEEPIPAAADGSESEDGPPPNAEAPLSPEAQEAIRVFSVSVSRQFADIHRSVLPALQVMADASEQMMAAVRPQLDRIREALEAQLPDLTEWARQAADTFRAQLPPNWEPSGWRAVVDLMRRTGWSLIWVPGPAVLSELVQATSVEAAEEILVRRDQEVLDDLAACVARVDAPELREHASGLREAVEAAGAGFHGPAQALTASVLTGLLHDLAGSPSAARKEWEGIDWLGQPITEFRTAGVLVAAATALEQFSPGQHRHPRRFNRHAVAHRYSRVQFTEANALVGLLLAVSLLRELQAQREEQP